MSQLAIQCYSNIVRTIEFSLSLMEAASSLCSRDEFLNKTILSNDGSYGDLMCLIVSPWFLNSRFSNTSSTHAYRLNFIGCSQETGKRVALSTVRSNVSCL